MLRRSATTGLMVEALQKVYTTVGVLSLPEVGFHQAVEALMELKKASWRTSAANSRSKSVMAPSGLVNMTSSWLMLSDHLARQM